MYSRRWGSKIWRHSRWWWHSGRRPHSRVNHRPGGTHRGWGAHTRSNHRGSCHWGSSRRRWSCRSHEGSRWRLLVQGRKWHGWSYQLSCGLGLPVLWQTATHLLLLDNTHHDPTLTTTRKLETNKAYSGVEIRTIFITTPGLVTQNCGQTISTKNVCRPSYLGQCYFQV